MIYQYLATAENRYLLFNLARDPSESHNLAKENPEQLKRIILGMIRELESMNPLYPVKDGNVLKPMMP